MECISRAKTPHLSLTGEIGMILRGNQCEVNFLRPCSEESSDAAQSTMSDQIKKQLFHLTMSAVNQIAKIVPAQKTECCGIEWFEKRKIDFEVLGLSLFPFQKKWQVRHWTSPVISVSHASLFVGLVLAWTTSPPAKEVLHLYRWFTHTHTAARNYCLCDW